ncbi:hypothetical protein SAMN06295967_11228 [Belliella buryatensis]|uniref:Uncharacterized protein n=1 Tax=Belliella buryatensis TaxID=1500549 RepID=A0A239FDC5_9BACT|nr:hypothetical protein [Belliella buryatensis]SNS54074.1 hypothetical protein SAMN06295967_11228 [Belliella buryatensis]
MTDREFDLIDELYFVQHYTYLKEVLGWEDEILLSTLQSLFEKEYIKCLKEPDLEIFNKIDLIESGKELYFLASKKGLMNHHAL